MIKHKLVYLLIGCLFLLVGCWDQRLLRDHSLILAIGYDLSEEERIQKIVTFPKEYDSSVEENQGTINSEIVVTNGDTVKDAEKKIDQIIPMKFDRSKAKIVVLGSDLAKDGIFHPLDSLYRDLRSPLNAKVFISETKATDALTVKNRYGLMVSDYYTELLKSTEISGIIYQQNVQSICPILLSEGEDIVLPYITLRKEGQEALVEGLALFSKDQMTGKLALEESMMLMILLGKHSPRAKINFQISNHEERSYDNFVDFTIRKMKRKVKVNLQDESIRASIDLNLRIEVDEFPKDHLTNRGQVKKLEEEIKEQFKKLAEKTIEKMQEANNDSLAIGQRVKAFHHKEWEKMNWKEIYPKIHIQPNFEVEIVRHGIIN